MMKVQDNDVLVERLWARKLMGEAERTGVTSVPGWILARTRFPIDRQKIIDMATDITIALNTSVKECGLPDYVVTVLCSTTRFVPSYDKAGFTSIRELAALSNGELKLLPTFSDTEVGLIRRAIRNAIENADEYTRRNAWNLNRA